MLKLLVQRQVQKAQVIIRFFLYNETTFGFACDLNLELGGAIQSKKGEYVKAEELKQIFSVPAHLLDSSPLLGYDCSQYSTLGFEGQWKGKVKVRGKDFISKMQKLDILSEPCIVYTLEGKIRSGVESGSGITVKRKESSGEHYHKMDLYNTEEFVNFESTLDLHLEKLVEDPSKVNPRMALMLQMSAFREYLDQAMRLGVDRVFIIHGVGKGKLRETVGQIARNLDHVREVKNEYHPKFGFGATEIIF
nr:Smr/MutS family protein [Saprospiraceae bacterium]